MFPLSQYDTIYVVWQSYPSDVLFSRSTDGGLSFQPALLVSDQKSETQTNPSIASDSNYNIYLVWTDDRGSTEDIFFSKSEEGVNFSTNMRVNDYEVGVQRNPSVAVSGSGEIYVVWEDDRRGDFDIYFSRSLDGGLSFENSVIVNDRTSGDQINPSLSVDLTGRIYVVWQDNAAGNWDIYWTVSSDGGKSFSNSLRVNDDVGDSDQIRPSIASDSEGNTYIVWQDDRNGFWDIYFSGSPHLLPDLSLSEGDLTTNPRDVIPNGTSVEISAMIHNLGWIYARDVNVSFYQGDPWMST